jgi:hypothetical protein
MERVTTARRAERLRTRCSVDEEYVVRFSESRKEVGVGG